MSGGKFGNEKLEGDTIRWKLSGNAKPIDFAECEQCGSDACVIETDSKQTGMYYDGDLIICLECGQKGQFSCDSETDGYISWIYED